MIRRTCLLAGVSLCLGAGCSDTGKVSLRFDVPDDDALKPAGAATMTLIARVGDDAPRATTAEIGDGTSIDLGELPVGDDIWLSAEMRTAQDHLVGYGQSTGPITVSATAVTEATIPVRRPFVYLAGAPSKLVSVDASVSAEQYRGEVATSATAGVVADVAGQNVAIINSAGALSYLSTSNNQAAGLAGAQLSGDPRDALATPDGTFLLVAHGGGSVSIVSVANGDVSQANVQGPADRLAVTRDEGGTWWGVALVGRATADSGCAASKLAAFPLTSPEQVNIVDAGIGISDLASDARTGQVLVADRCGDRVLRFDPVAGSLDTTTPLLSIDAPTTIAAADGRVWALGHAAQPGSVPDGIADAWLIIGTADLTTGDASVENLPPVIERALAHDIDYPDQDVTQDLHANKVEAHDLAVMPGAEELAFTMHAEIHGDAFQDVFGDVVLPTLDMTTEEYVLIDASTLATSQHLRTSCTMVVGPCDTGCIEDSWDCLPDIDTLTSMFTPSGMTALFGAR